MGLGLLQQHSQPRLDPPHRIEIDLAKWIVKMDDRLRLEPPSDELTHVVVAVTQLVSEARSRHVDDPPALFEVLSEQMQGGEGLPHVRLANDHHTPHLLQCGAYLIVVFERFDVDIGQVE